MLFVEKIVVFAVLRRKKIWSKYLSVDRKDHWIILLTELIPATACCLLVHPGQQWPTISDKYALSVESLHRFEIWL